MSILPLKINFTVLLIVAIGIIIVSVLLINHIKHNSKPEDFTPVYTGGTATSSSNAITIGENSISTSNGEAKVYGQSVPKNVSVVPYLDDNDKLQVKLVAPDEQNHTGQKEP